MGMDFQIYVENTDDAKKYFKQNNINYISNKDRKVLYDKDQVYFCCGRPLTNFVSNIADLANKPDKNNGYKQKIQLKKLKKYVDNITQLETLYKFRDWDKHQLNLYYYDNEILGYDEKLQMELYAEKQEFNNLKKYEGIRPETVKIVREIDRAEIKKLNKLYDYKREAGDYFLRSVDEIDSELGELARHGSYFASAVEICKVIRDLTETFGEKYNIYIDFSY